MTDKINGHAADGKRRSKGAIYLDEAVRMYEPGVALKDIYRAVAKKYGVNAAAVDRSVALCVSRLQTDTELTPKSYIARTKERLLFENDE